MNKVSEARKLRRNQTDAERKLWFELRGRRLHGLKFRRQVPVAGFIADFLSEEIKLIVEVDGGQHAETIEEDDERTKVLSAAGYQVVRFWNDDVLTNIEGVLERILEAGRCARNEI
ncbi:MAG: endonuclease domain-containing protein [Rhodomicrobium sp.]|nr:endonuclease domain-containing protein [Rhodomicrobium sp.]